MLKQFVSSAEPASKQLYSLLNHLQTKAPHKILVNHAIKVNNFGGQKKFGIVANEDILSRSRIFSLSLTQAITGFEIADAENKTKNRLEEIAEKIAKKYHENNPSQYYFTINLFKVIFQILAQQSEPSLSLHEYSKYLYENYPKDVALNWPNHMEQYIFSSHLKNLIEAQRTYLYTLAGDLDQNGLPHIKYDELFKTISIVRSRSLNFLPHKPKQFTKDTVTIVSPVVDLLNHSFNPNCQIEGFYNSFENDSFVEVKAINDIKKGEELTLNYGDLSNYEYLMKYGFLNENNPFDVYPVSLDFGDSLEYTSQVFELKHKIFSLIPDFQLDKIKVYKDKIDANMLGILRAYFLTEEDIKANPEINSYTPRDFKEKISNANERHIYELIIKNVKRELDTLESARKDVIRGKQVPGTLDKDVFYSMDTLKANRAKINDDNLSNIIQIGLEEEYTLKRNLEFCNKQLSVIPK